jgi:hypothetical protein
MKAEEQSFVQEKSNFRFYHSPERPVLKEVKNAQGEKHELERLL